MTVATLFTSANIYIYILSFVWCHSSKHHQTCIVAVQHSHNSEINSMHFYLFILFLQSVQAPKILNCPTESNKGYTQDEQSKSPSTLHHMERVNYKIQWYTPTHQSEHPKWLSSTATTGNFTQTHLFQQDDPVDEGVQGWGAKDAQFDANKYGSHHILHPLKPQRMWRKLCFFD